MLVVAFGAAGLLAADRSAADATAPDDYSDFARYQAILDRQPFGASAEAAGGPSVVELPTPSAPPFVKDLRMCFIRESANGLRVGLVDIAGNPPKTYMLWIGDEQDGLTLVDADYEMGAALLRKGDQEHWIYIDGGPGRATPGTASAGPSTGPSTGPSVGVSGAAGGGAEIPGVGESYKERLIKRRLAVRVKTAPELPPETPVLTDQEKSQVLQDYQMELIRAGGELGPPLPIALTPAMDQQLVAEGVLPPPDETPVVNE